MKKYKSAISIFVFCLIVPSMLIIAETLKTGEKVSIFTHFNMEIIDDGKLTDNQMLADLHIFNYRGRTHVVWNHVYIDPQHDLKKVILKAQHYSTQEGTISEVVVSKNHFSFKIDVSTALFPGRTVQVVGNRSEDSHKYSIEGTALWWSYILNRKIKTEWRTTDKKIMLPYKEVF